MLVRFDVKSNLKKNKGTYRSFHPSATELSGCESNHILKLHTLYKYVLIRPLN